MEVPGGMGPDLPSDLWAAGNALDKVAKPLLLGDFWLHWGEGN
jgi:hypothetical protein